MAETTGQAGEGMWDQLRRRKVVQWGIAYAAGAWGLLQGIQFLVEAFEWPSQSLRLATIAFAVGLPVVLALAWYHGDRGEQRVTAVESTVVTVLFLLGGFLFWRYERASGVATVTTPAPAGSQAVAPIQEGITADKSIAVLPFVTHDIGRGTGVFLRRSDGGNPQPARQRGGPARHIPHLVVFVQG